MLITTITFQKTQDKARFFIYTHKAFIFTSSDAECHVSFGYGRLSENFL